MSINAIQNTRDTAMVPDIKTPPDTAEIEIFTTNTSTEQTPIFDNLDKQFTWLLNKGEKVVDRNVVKLALSAPTWLKGLGMKWKDAVATQEELLGLIKQEKVKENYILEVKNYVKKDGRNIKDVFSDKKSQDELIILTKEWLTKEGKTNVHKLFENKTVDNAIREFMTDFDNQAYKDVKK